MKKLEYYGARMISSKWFGSDLRDWKQFVSLNGYNSNLADVKYRVAQRSIFKYTVLQGSIPEPLFFLVYITNLHVAIMYSEVHHIADIVHKGIPPPFLRHPPLDPACPLFKIFASLTSFLFCPLLSYFRLFPPPLRNLFLP